MKSSTRSSGATTGWGWAAVLSAAAHAAFLTAVGVQTSGTSPDIALDPARRTGLAVEAVALVDLAALDEVAAVLPPGNAIAPASAPPTADDARARPADETRQAPASLVAPRPGAPERATAAPDRDDGAGRRTEDPAWRRDSSTLHDRLTDGAERYQPAHTRTPRASAPSSPQAQRREPVVGPGDSPRTTRERSVVVAPPTATVDPDGATAPDGALPSPDREAQRAAGEAPSPSPSRLVSDAPGASATHTEGPLDAERGATAFDVAPGDVARDTRARRAASSEPHPSITDLSLAASPGADVRGRGPSEAPGAVARLSPDAAPAVSGFEGPPGATGDATPTRERLYARYELDIRARVNGVLARVWPRALALRLEQGETMVSFVVQPDGHLAGPVRVTKSAGFEEFDRAAVEAIRLVTPFPPIPRGTSGGVSPLSVSLRVIFSNPVIR